MLDDVLIENIRKNEVSNVKKMVTKIVKPLVERFPTIARKYQQIRDSRALHKEHKMSKLGFRFNGNEQMEQGLFEPIETCLVNSLLQKVDYVINICANIGYYVCQALSNNKRVLAFEPIETNLKYFMRNIKANGWQENCEIFPVALGDKTDIIEIYGGGTGASLIKGWAGTSERYSSLVPCLTLNHVLGDRFDGENIIIIVDIEGSENMMLEGASKLLNMSPKPIWLVEISGEEHQPKGFKINPFILETFKKFWDSGYESITADNKLRKITKEEILMITETEIDSLGTHNFLFYDRNKNPFKWYIEKLLI
jgi:FkbM family methyltransferase